MHTPGTGSPLPPPLRLNGFVLDAARRELRTPSGELAVLRPKALELLIALGETPGHVVPKEALMERVWPRVIVTDDSLTQLVNEIRRLLGDGERRVLRTVPRRGYLLAADAQGGPASMPAGAMPATNLPWLPAVLHGRERDLATCDALLREHRLVSITGPGGIGKTRLALAVGHAALGRFAHGVWLIDLAARTQAADVLPALATAAGIEPSHGDTLGRVLAALAPRETLLVLDNCEHLADEVARLAMAVLGATPHVRLLATTQVPLRVIGETQHRLDVLAVPPEELDAASALRFGAFALFRDRVREAGLDADFDARTTAAAIDICRRLDGVPLALEMAAARVPALGMAGVQERLGERLRLLRTARLQVPPRHETLRATLEWSCSLLDEAEAKVLRRLAVFSGRFEVQVARPVIAADDLDEWEALDALCGLVDKSLVRTEGYDPVHYRLLETTRLHARERLVAAGELEATLDRHAHAMADYPRTYQKLHAEVPDDQLTERGLVYIGDLDRAFERLAARGDAERAATTLLALRWIAQMSGDQASMEPRLRIARPLLDHASGLAKARLLTMFASCGWLTIDGLTPLQAARDAVAEWRRAPPDPSAMSHALMLQATGASIEGHTGEAYAALREGFAMSAALKMPKRHLIARIHAGHVALFCGDAAACVETMQSALVEARALGASRMAWYIQAFLPEAALMAGDTARAVALASEAVRDLRAFGQGYLANASESLVAALLQHGDLDGALAEAPAALPLAWAYELDDKMSVNLARLAAGRDRTLDAAVLAGFAMARLQPLRNAVDRWRQAQCEALQPALERSLGPAALAQALAEGAALDAAGALERASRVVERV